MSEELLLVGVGDVGPGPHRKDPNSILANVKDTLSEGDFVFGQCEIVVTDRGVPPPHTGLPMRTPPASAAAYKAAGFNVMSFASNHGLDWGLDGLFDTIEHLENNGIKQFGAGPNLAEARKPVYLEKDGTRVAFIGRCSILPMGYWADRNRAGVAPLRANTLYEQIEYHQPGTPARILSFAHKEDLALLLEDIATAKENADIVVMSFHWGVHFMPGVIADYQREVAHACIDAGADLILGHHPHILKPTEVYKGKAIFYSLGNFAIEQPQHFSEDPNRPHSNMSRLRYLNPTIGLSEDWILPFDSRKTLIVKAVISNKQIQRVSMVPAYLNLDAEPEVVTREDERFDEVLTYMKEIGLSQDIDNEYTVEGNEIVLATS